jgi:S1-C subfamily serine protease
MTTHPEISRSPSGVPRGARVAWLIVLRRSSLAFSCALLTIVALACSDEDGVPAGATSSDTSSATQPAEGGAGTGSDLVTAVQRVNDKVRPAVVHITNEQVIDGLFASATQPAGAGSGVIYDQQGLVLTNNHVVAGAERLVVALPDGRTFTGVLVGADPITDLAVIRIDGDNLPVASIGDAAELEVGEWVVAIGNALSLPGGPTVTSGVVSALGRAIQAPPGDPRGQVGGPVLLDLIQTDAAINPGNSGGPLVNLDGEVVGINTLAAGTSPSGIQAVGIGFAISSSTFTRIAKQLVENGRAVHPYVGIRYVSLTPAIAAELGVKATHGAAIAEVVPGSPAGRAGLQPRDVVVAIEGEPLNSESALPRIIDAHRPGDTVTFTIERRSRTQDVDVTLGDSSPVIMSVPTHRYRVAILKLATAVTAE